MRWFIILFFVPYARCAPNFTITPELLESVFGLPPLNGTLVDQSVVAPPAAGQVAQAAAVVPNPTNELNDFEESDVFIPAAADYDKFDWTLTKRVASCSQENFLLSPLGLKLALSILMEASTGNTQAELSSVLGLDLDRNVIRMKFAKILDSLQTTTTRYILNLGSRIYVADNAEVRQRFAAISQQYYKTEILKADFSKPKVAAADINQWVSNLTHGRIPDLVDEDDVTGVALLVLNTLFFKGTWRHQFVPNATREDSFYVNSTMKKQSPFMHVRDKFYFSDSSKFNAKILRMPYLGSKFAMYIVLPNSIMGLPQIYNELSELRAELYYLREHLVDVTLPKFQFEYTSQLDGILQELGIRQAFEDTASFPGISRGQTLSSKLKISKVLQRSGIEVNELGSVAYSATEIYLVNKFGSDDMPSAEVVANKPFMFFIQDEATRQLLFTGRVTDPTLFDGAYKLT